MVYYVIKEVDNSYKLVIEQIKLRSYNVKKDLIQGKNKVIFELVENGPLSGSVQEIALGYTYGTKSKLFVEVKNAGALSLQAVEQGDKEKTTGRPPRSKPIELDTEEDTGIHCYVI